MYVYLVGILAPYSVVLSSPNMDVFVSVEWKIKYLCFLTGRSR